MNTPVIYRILELKHAYNGWLGVEAATKVELSEDLREALLKEVEPLIEKGEYHTDGRTRVWGLEIVEVSGTNHMEIK